MFQVVKTLIVIEVLLAAGLFLFRASLARSGTAVVSTKVIVLMLVTPVVGFFCGDIRLFLVYLIAIVAFNARSTRDVAAFYVAILPMLPSLTFPLVVGGVYLMPVGTITAMNLGALIGFAFSRRRKPLVLRRYDLLALGLMLIFVYIYGREASSSAILRTVIGYVISFLAPYLLLSRSVANRHDLEFILLHLLLGASLMAVTAAFQAGRHWVLYQILYQQLHVSLPALSFSLSMRAGLLRTGGSMLDYSAGGLFLAVAVCLLPLLRGQFRTSRYWVVMALLIAGLIATQSRGGWLAALVGAVVMLFYRRRTNLALGLGVGAGLAELAIITFAKTGKLASIVGNTEEANGTIDFRKDLWRLGKQEVINHPLFGQTPDALVARLSELTHQGIVDFVNSHLFVAMAAGVPLFCVWVYIWTSVMAKSWTLRRSSESDLAGVPLAMILPTMVALVATSLIDRNLTWPIIALGLAGPCFSLAGKRQRRPRQAVVASSGTHPALAA